MSQKADRELTQDQISRRSFLHGSVGAAAVVGSGLLVTPQTAAAAEGGLVALVHTQAAGDNGPINSMIAALKKLSAEKKFPIRTIYAQDAATYGTIFKSLADANAAIIVATFNEVAEPIKALAPKYPNTKWIQIFGDPIQPPIPNFETVSYDYYLGCYLSGMFAAKMSKTGKIGYIGGVSLPPLNADVNSMKAAIASVNPSATFTPAFVGSFQDPAKGHETASQMYQGGIDYIQTEFSRHRHRNHSGGERGRRPDGQRHLASAVQDRSQDSRRSCRSRFRSVSLQRSVESARPRIQGRTSGDGAWNRRD